MGQDDAQRLRGGGTGGGGLSELVTLLVPDPVTALAAGAGGLAAAAIVGAFAARLRARGVRVAYTRKIFHFGIFTGAAVVHFLWALPGTNAYGAVVALIVLVTVLRGEGHPLYEALARERDRPHRSLFIVVPLVTTALGGLASALLAGPHAGVGYLVAGWGDAVGEPVGSRWGRHPYRVPSLAGVPAERTLEGSAAVLLVSWLAATLVLAARRGWHPDVVFVALACAAAAAAVEALSHHGLDNLTVQLAASLTAAALSP